MHRDDVTDGALVAPNIADTVKVRSLASVNGNLFLGDELIFAKMLFNDLPSDAVGIIPCRALCLEQDDGPEMFASLRLFGIRRFFECLLAIQRRPNRRFPIRISSEVDWHFDHFFRLQFGGGNGVEDIGCVFFLRWLVFGLGRCSQFKDQGRVKAGKGTKG